MSLLFAFRDGEALILLAQSHSCVTKYLLKLLTLIYGQKHYSFVWSVSPLLLYSMDCSETKHSQTLSSWQNYRIWYLFSTANSFKYNKKKEQGALMQMHHYQKVKIKFFL